MSQDLFNCGNVNTLVYVLVILFGVASWVDINGLWVELPILVQNLPEGWDLPSYMAIIIQKELANVAPLLYTLASWRWPQQNFETPVIYTIISLGTVACLLLAMLWDVTSEIAGSRHSTALLILQFFLALVDCTSSVAFLPFMFTLKAQYMTAYFIGEGFSGLIPSLVALGQGAGSMECVTVTASYAGDGNSSLLYKNVFQNKSSEFNSSLSFAMQVGVETTQPTLLNIYPKFLEPRFSVGTFFLILMTFLIISNISFTFLKYCSYCKREYTSQEIDYVEDASCVDMIEKNEDPIPNVCKKYKLSSALDDFNGKTFVLFLMLTAWLNALSNGVLPSIQTYSCLPYGIKPYHLSVTLAAIANPVACFAASFITISSILSTVTMTVVGSGIAGYIVYTAAASPNPPLVGMAAGTTVVVLCWILVIFFLTYTKVCIATVCRKEGQGKRALLWVGAFTQLGSLVGALVTFVLVNVYKIFIQGNPCI
ncbi:hypothetical protein EGW08_021478 [Elysia chlorotica]|uniref:Riboflavin transporter n=1 Tax=Elysia chlorotica TaxID=188477 RepID=A0A433SNH9_ELYCH|nr:hypothetical protein EGW08_021478 [Elysia chlorotica]